jgi:hypothetical protein
VEATIRNLTDLSGIDAQLEEKMEGVAGSHAALERRRARIRKKIPGLLLASYDALARSGRRPVVVPLQNAHCSGCRLRLPPQLDSSIRRHRTLCPCPYCHRLLYAPGDAHPEADSRRNKVEARHVPPGPMGKKTGSVDTVRATLPKSEPRVKATGGRNTARLRRKNGSRRLSERARTPGAGVVT